MSSRIDSFLNQVTSYRLVLYILIAVLSWASILVVFRQLPFSLVELLYSVGLLTLTSVVVNKIFSRMYHVVANIESVYITSLILALIVTPSFANTAFLVGVAFLSQSSKYLFTFRRRHVFNPAAAAVFLTAAIFNFPASWWVGTGWMLPAVIAGGFLIISKLRYWGLVGSFVAASLISMAALMYSRGYSPVASMINSLIHSPLVFFATIMLTEPLTAPSHGNKRIIYGVLIGVVSNFSTPEVALLIGNIVSFLIHQPSSRVLKLQNKIRLSPDIYDLVFTSDHPLSFSPGQYLEWTLPAENTDNRGNRRYFTLASSPTESVLRIGVKSPPHPSSFKKTLLSLNPGQSISVGQLAGDFTLPVDPAQKLVFIAGGVGITPFRSMVKYLIDLNQPRKIVLFYQAKNQNEFIYRDIFKQAEKLNVYTIYNTTRLTGDLISQTIPDYLDYIYYLSGPMQMVNAYKQVLLDLGIPRSRIRTDYFPGF